MKSRLLIIIVILAVFVTVSGIFLMESEPRVKTIFCDSDSTPQENGCFLDPKSVEPNTIVIYHVIENAEAKLAIAPNILVIDFEKNNTVNWVNQGIFTANVTDKVINPSNVTDLKRSLWGIDEIKPSMQKSLQLNGTGYYSFLVVADMEGRIGQIVVLGDDVNSLSVSNRVKMAQAIITNNVRENPELIGVGNGGGTEVSIEINEKELELHEDAKLYYYEKYSKMIPFDVPITIEFGKPASFAEQGG